MPVMFRPAVVSSVALACAVSASVLRAERGDDEHEPMPVPQFTEAELPPGAVRVVTVARRGGRVAVCVEEPGPRIEHGTRLIPRTRVWVDDGVKNRPVGTAPGTCDPAWSMDGERVAVVAPDGLWVFTADLRVTMHLVDTRHTEFPGDEAAHRTLSGPAWAPDGSRVAFTVSNQVASWVEVVDARTGQVIYSSDPETYDFAWGADSASLQFGSRVVRLP